MAEDGMNLNNSPTGTPVMGKDASGLAKFVGVDANGGLRTSAGALTPLGYEQITTLSAAAGLTVPDGATIAIITAEAQAVRWRDDGTNPSATVGMPIAVNAPFTYSGDLSAIKFFEQAASAKLNVSYFK